MPNFETPIVVASLLALADIHVAELDDGVVAYVQSTKQYFDLDKFSGAAANGVSVIIPNIGSPIAGAANARWILAVGAVGPPGSPGPVGPTGTPAVTNYGSFFALMPGDNAATIAVGAAVLFPQDGPANDPVGGIRRSSSSQVILPLVGTYEINWQVSVAEAGQLMLGLDSGAGVVELAPTVAGRATGTSQIMNSVYITTTAPNSVLTVRNPSGNAAALTLTPSAGGTHAVSAWLTVKQLA